MGREVMTFAEFQKWLLPEPAETFNKAEMLLGLRLAWNAATEEAAKQADEFETLAGTLGTQREKDLCGSIAAHIRALKETP
jgi:hypothetical protein